MTTDKSIVVISISAISNVALGCGQNFAICYIVHIAAGDVKRFLKRASSVGLWPREVKMAEKNSNLDARIL